MRSIWRALSIGSSLLFTLSLAACGGSNPAQPPPPTPAATQGPVPAELQGVWGTVVSGPNAQVTLTLTPGTYEIDRADERVVGSATVSGDTIEFSQSNVCNGTGDYTWSATGASLLLTQIREQCPGRSEVMASRTYTRIR